MPTNHISAAEAAEVWDYDRKTGQLTWKIAYGRNQPGAAAGKARPDGYISVGYKGRTYGAHRIALAIVQGKWPAHQVDHKNRNPSDNRRENIRQATPAQNAQNRGLKPENPRPVAGVRFEQRVGGGMWIARITVKGRDIGLGKFYNYWEAVAARVRAERKYHPYKVQKNTPEGIENHPKTV